MRADTRFIFIPADDETVDAEYRVIGGKRQVSVQVCPYAGGYAVNEYGLDDPADEASFWCRDHGVFRSLDRAKRKALRIADQA